MRDHIQPEGGKELLQTGEHHCKHILHLINIAIGLDKIVSAIRIESDIHEHRQEDDDNLEHFAFVVADDRIQAFLAASPREDPAYGGSGLGERSHDLVQGIAAVHKHRRIVLSDEHDEHQGVGTRCECVGLGDSEQCVADLFRI